MNNTFKLSEINSKHVKDLYKTASPADRAWIKERIAYWKKEKKERYYFTSFRKDFAKRFYPTLFEKDLTEKQPTLLDELLEIDEQTKSAMQ